MSAIAENDTQSFMERQRAIGREIPPDVIEEVSPEPAGRGKIFASGTAFELSDGRRCWLTAPTFGEVRRAFLTAEFIELVSGVKGTKVEVNEAFISQLEGVIADFDRLVCSCLSVGSEKIESLDGLSADDAFIVLENFAEFVDLRQLIARIQGISGKVARGAAAAGAAPIV